MGCTCVLQIAELKRAIAVGRKKVKERRAVEEQLVQRQIEVLGTLGRRRGIACVTLLGVQDQL